ncbi:MAG TPA: hypothetical protein PL193_04070 [Xanthobacteraceae bacterium]|nr:hypothetical protein [Xanthobacteraceae bacterium]
MLIRLLIAFDALVAAGILFFFFWGVSDGTVSSFNVGIWLALLAGTALSLVGGFLAYRNNNRVLAILLLLILALPGIAFALFALFLIIAQPRWN